MSTGSEIRGSAASNSILKPGGTSNVDSASSEFTALVPDLSLQAMINMTMNMKESGTRKNLLVKTFIEFSYFKNVEL